MPDRYVEKNFLYLLLFSALLHVGAFLIITTLPQEQPKTAPEPTFVDLTDLPEPPSPVKPKPEAKPKPAPMPVPRPVPKPLPPPNKNVVPADVALPKAVKNPAPKDEHKESKSTPLVKGKPETIEQPPISAGKTDAESRTAEKEGKEPMRGEGLLRPQAGKKVDLSKLFPSAKNMKSIEDSYRKKYEASEQGDTRLIDTQDPLVAVYGDRLLRAANGKLLIEQKRRPLRETGVIGVVMVTLDRAGNIEDTRMLETTGSQVIDEMAITAIRTAGYFGPIPQKWPHEKLKFIWIVVPPRRASP